MKLIDRRPVDAKDAALPMGESEIVEAFSKIDRSTLEGLRGLCPALTGSYHRTQVPRAGRTVLG